MTFKQLFSLCKKAVVAWSDDFAPSMGAAISYYTLFSLAPLLVIVIAIAGALFGREAVQGEIVGQLSGLIGREAAIAVQGLIRSASEPGKGLVAGLIGVGVLIVGATTVFAELQSALDRIWHVPPSAKPKGVWSVLRARVLSFGLILGLAFLLMVSLLVSAFLAAMGSWVGALLPGWELMLQLLNIAISFAIMTLLFAMIYKFMPTTRIAWRDVWVGAAVTSMLFQVGKTAIALYLGRSSMTESFAAAGSLVVLLVWVYYAAQIFLLGAEFTKVYALEHGSVADARLAASVAHPPVVPTQTTTGQPDAGDATPPPAAMALTQTGEVQAEVDRRLQGATRDLARQLLLLGGATVLSVAASQWQKRLRKKDRLRRKAFGRRSGPRGTTA
ncbi:MAG: YihY/virulence factor BrkB family protein [Gammaproteobacteria bacterium]|uniref:YihY/virulence factor BrkB family protein n=1 Tax=Pseudacidovorax sp. TaxID=1934311 RepID=UPI001B69FC87|nr:YihY/virulence factor BrkB family protein [Pseudacidovorax sp.]MBP6898399.1 YihY/virulence factor BrkB family protein [Pseudacidovorax sp.]